MKKIMVSLLLVGIFAAAYSQSSGIAFEQGSWEEVRKKALSEKKLIFADFYTEWCGPCLTMSEEVFPLSGVGEFYNTHFVNVKVDAEKGEGKLLGEKYQVVSYPTFLFIDPQGGEIVHRSSSRQEAATFLFTGRSAIMPELRSLYLEKEYAEGNRSRKLLGNYLDYLASVYQREKVKQLAAEYAALPDFSLKRPEDWTVFVKHIAGIDNSSMRSVMENKKSYTDLYGEKEVDGKLFQEFNLSLDMEALQAAPDFRGKAFLLLKNQAEKHLRNKEYEAAIPLLDSMMAEPGEFNEELCHYLKFSARSVLYGEYPDFWLKKCAEMAQYVAYNSYHRQDAGIHYDYAVILEKLIRTIPEARKYFPDAIIGKPVNGMKDYSLRSPKLKAKKLKK